MRSVVPSVTKLSWAANRWSSAALEARGGPPWRIETSLVLYDPRTADPEVIAVPGRPTPSICAFFLVRRSPPALALPAPFRTCRGKRLRLAFLNVPARDGVFVRLRLAYAPRRRVHRGPHPYCRLAVFA